MGHAGWQGATSPPAGAAEALTHGGGTGAQANCPHTQLPLLFAGLAGGKRHSNFRSALEEEETAIREECLEKELSEQTKNVA